MHRGISFTVEVHRIFAKFGNINLTGIKSKALFEKLSEYACNKIRVKKIINILYQEFLEG